MMRKIGLGLFAIALLLTSTLTSCKPKNTTISETSTLPPKAEQPQKQSGKPAEKPSAMLNPSTAARKITFRQPDGTPEFSLQFKATGAKLIDRSGKVMANLILQSDGVIQLTDANNKTVGYVSQTEGTWQVESPNRAKVLFTFRETSDGNATLVRNDGSAVYELQATDSGYTVESGKGNRYTVSAIKGNGQLQTGDGEVIMATDGAIAPAALASFGFAKLTPAQQAGLAYALSTESTIN